MKAITLIGALALCLATGSVNAQIQNATMGQPGNSTPGTSTQYIDGSPTQDDHRVRDERLAQNDGQVVDRRTERREERLARRSERLRRQEADNCDGGRYKTMSNNVNSSCNSYSGDITEKKK